MAVVLMSRSARARQSEASVIRFPEKSAQALTISNRQHTRRVRISPLRRLTKTLLLECLLKTEFDLSVCLVNASEITSLNESFLHHKGPTDVITFDYSDTGAAGGIFGEIFICVDQAVSHARRFHTTWQSEMVRYIVHGLLHLCGYDDRSATSRHEMKVAENRLLRQRSRRHAGGRLAGAGAFQSFAAIGRQPLDRTGKIRMPRPRAVQRRRFRHMFCARQSLRRLRRLCRLFRSIRRGRPAIPAFAFATLCGVRPCVFARLR